MYPNNDFEKLDLVCRFYAWSEILDKNQESKESLGMDDCKQVRKIFLVMIHNLENRIAKSICDRLKRKIETDVKKCLSSKKNGKESHAILFKNIPCDDDLNLLKHLSELIDNDDLDKL